MNKLILIRPYNYENKNNTVEQNLYDCGQNSGNIIWYEAIKKSVKWDMERRESLFNGSDDKYIVPMANHISLHTNVLECLDTYLNKSKDIVMLGLGAQLTDEYNTPKKLIKVLPKQRVNALQNISKKSVSIGIRGEITAECLELMGIHNYKIIGCPSFYSDKKKIYNLCQHKKNSNLNGIIGINLAAYGKMQLAYFLNALKNKGMLNKSYFILQHLMDMPKTIYNNVPILQRHVDNKYPGLEMSVDEWTKYIKEHGIIFFNNSEWIQFIQKNISKSMGMRFHGNMAALLAGVPAVWIVHDSRTLELCQALELPYFNIEKINKDIDINEISELTNKYNEVFWKKYCDKYTYYKGFLKENGLDMR